jgi:hypothetical protein
MRILKLGSTGQDVLALAKRLKDTGFLKGNPGLKFTQELQYALMDFQTSRMVDHRGEALKVDGEFGPICDRLLFPEKYKTPDQPTTSRFVNEMLKLAVSQEGVREVGGDNRGPKIEEYQRSTGNRRGDSWCCSYIYWLAMTTADKLDIANPMPARTGHCQTMLNAAKEKGLLINPTEARPGDIGVHLYKSTGVSPGHIFLIKESETGYWDTNEGNTNGSGSSNGDVVRQGLRKYSYVSPGGVFRLKVPQI